MVINNKYKENMERIRVNVLKNKEMVDEMKRFKELELENKKMKINDLPVLLLTGYLGSGKTTLLNRILSNKQGIKFAVIVNDIGEVNIDASLIQQGGVVSQKDDSLVALQNGCICCTLQTDLINQLHDRLQDEGISEDLIKHVADRLGHDRRYGIDPTKIKNDLGWYPETPFEKGIVLTIDWYLAHEEWMDHVTSGNYQKYYEQMYKNK